MIQVDFNTVKTIILGMRGSLRRSRMDEVGRWLDKMDEMVETAAYQEIVQPGVILANCGGILQ